MIVTSLQILAKPSPLPDQTRDEEREDANGDVAVANQEHVDSRQHTSPMDMKHQDAAPECDACVEANLCNSASVQDHARKDKNNRLGKQHERILSADRWNRMWCAGFHSTWPDDQSLAIVLVDAMIFLPGDRGARRSAWSGRFINQYGAAPSHERKTPARPDRLA